MSSRILPILALIVSVGIFFGYVDPTWTGPVTTAKAAITDDNTALAAANQYVARQNQLASARDAIDPANLARLSTFLPSSVDNVGIILDLDALAARSGLSLSNIDVSSADTSGNAASQGGALPAAGASPVGTVDLSLSAVGTYASLLNFLAGVENSERLLDVEDLTVKGSDTGAYSYSMKLRLYWLR